MELVLGWNNIPFERILYGYGDIETPTKLFGKKVLPILEYDGKIIRESLDIVSFINSIHGVSRSTLAPETHRFDSWIDQQLKPWQRILSRPRIPKMPVYDWAQPEDAAYARDKYSKQGFDYDDALNRTNEAIEQVNLLLVELDSMLFSIDSANSWGVSLDDIILIPELRTLTCTKGIEWPTRVNKYLHKLSARAGVKLYSENSVA